MFQQFSLFFSRFHKRLTSTFPPPNATLCVHGEQWHAWSRDWHAESVSVCTRVRCGSRIAGDYSANDKSNAVRLKAFICLESEQHTMYVHIMYMESVARDTSHVGGWMYCFSRGPFSFSSSLVRVSRVGEIKQIPRRIYNNLANADSPDLWRKAQSSRENEPTFIQLHEHQTGYLIILITRVPTYSVPRNFTLASCFHRANRNPRTSRRTNDGFLRET